MSTRRRRLFLKLKQPITNTLNKKKIPKIINFLYLQVTRPQVIGIRYFDDRKDFFKSQKS